MESMMEMTRDLVRIPSRAGTDSYDPIVSGITRWLGDLGLPHEVRRNSSGTPVAVVSVIDDGHPGPTYVLDATFDLG
jgi:succinyl-diaminopimelate desuccinylase